MSTATDAHPPLTQGTPMAPLDAALEYLRLNLLSLLPRYIAAALPFSLAMLWVIDNIAAQHRSALPAACLALTIATFWRWLGLASLQRHIQHQLRGEPPLRVRQRWLSILYLRLLANFGLTWASIVVVPGFYGFFLSTLATPALLEADEPSPAQLRKVLAWISSSNPRLLRVTTSVSVASLIVVVVVVASQVVLLNTLLPNLLGLNVTDLRIAMTSPAWVLGCCYLLFMAFDLFWAVAGVMLFYDLQARQLGTDLRVRLQRLRGAAA